MEAAGLGIGIVGLAGLFSSCVDIAERWDSYKEFLTEVSNIPPNPLNKLPNIENAYSKP